MFKSLLPWTKGGCSRVGRVGPPQNRSDLAPSRIYSNQNLG